MTDKPKLKMKRRSGIQKMFAVMMLLAVIVLCGGLAFVAYLANEFLGYNNFYGDEAVVKIIEFMDISLPDTVTDVSIQVTGWIEPRMQMWFTLPQEDAENWLRDRGLCVTEQGIWWDVENAVNDELRVLCMEGIYRYDVVVDISASDLWALSIDMIDV